MGSELGAHLFESVGDTFLLDTDIGLSIPQDGGVGTGFFGDFGVFISDKSRDVDGVKNRGAVFLFDTEPGCGGLPATIVGTAAGEVIVGTSGPDVIMGAGETTPSMVVAGTT